jgi:hypothetical protein
MVCKLLSIARNNLTLRNPLADRKGAEVAMQEKVNDVDEEKRSLSSKLISPYGEASSFLAGNRY